MFSGGRSIELYNFNFNNLCKCLKYRFYFSLFNCSYLENYEELADATSWSFLTKNISSIFVYEGRAQFLPHLTQFALIKIVHRNGVPETTAAAAVLNLFEINIRGAKEPNAAVETKTRGRDDGIVAVEI